MEANLTRNAAIFKAFCDENRLGILGLLRSGEKCVCVLAERMGIGQSALSYHMRILLESGIVLARQEGKWTYYRISAEGCARAAELLRDITTPDELQEEPICCND